MSCAARNPDDWNQPGALSPDGRAKARVIHIEGSSSSQILLSFDGGRCGGGSISAAGSTPDLELSWRDTSTLEVGAPESLQLEPAPSSRTLDHTVQCLDKIVRVVTRRR